jgi:hypothetical protein
VVGGLLWIVAPVVVIFLMNAEDDLAEAGRPGATKDDGNT